MRTPKNNRTGNEQKPEKTSANRAPSVSQRPGPSSPQRLAWLQRSAGNAAVVQMLRRAGDLQDPEQHQHNAGCGHQETEQATPPVQRSAVHDVLRTGGRPLDDATRTDMEDRLGADFSDVRIHNDAAAKASAAEVGARAYTSGTHVVIGDAGSDKHTLAHELTHVIQQRRGPVAGTDNGDGLSVSDPYDRFEREAEENARRTMAAGPQAAPDPQSSTAASRTPASLPSVQRADVSDPQSVLGTSYWETKAGVEKPDGSKDSNLKTALIAAGKKEGAVGETRRIDEIIRETGPKLLQQLAGKSPTDGKLELFRSMSLAEAQGIVSYWGNPNDRNNLTSYIAGGQGTAKDFRKGQKGMVIGVHLGDEKQADAYYTKKGKSYEVQLKFTLRPGAHEVLFDPEYMALGPGYESELIRKAKGGTFPNAPKGEGTLQGHIGVKAEEHQPFSLSIAQNKKKRDEFTASQLLFQLFVEQVSVVKDKTGTLQQGEV